MWQNSKRKAWENIGKSLRKIKMNRIKEKHTKCLKLSEVIAFIKLKQY